MNLLATLFLCIYNLSAFQFIPNELPSNTFLFQQNIVGIQQKLWLTLATYLQRITIKLGVFFESKLKTLEYSSIQKIHKNPNLPNFRSKPLTSRI